MPRGDGTGPRGMGPMTGGGFGYCSGFAPRLGYGFRGRGYGRMYPGVGMQGRFFNDYAYGNSNRGYYQETNEEEMLKEQEMLLNEELKQVKSRLETFKENS